MCKQLIYSTAFVLALGLLSANAANADITSNLIAHYELENAGDPGLDSTGNYPGTGPSVAISSSSSC